MTKNRNIPADQAETQRLLDQIGEGPYRHLGYVSWLGHTDGAGLADALLLIGATESQLHIARPGSLEEHIDHLRTAHGINVSVLDGIYRLEVQ